MSKKHFHQALNQLDLHKKTKEVEIPGILGFTVNGVQVVDVPYRPGYVYVRLRNNTSEVIQAFNENTNALYNLPVIIVRDEVDRSRYKVKGRDLGAYQNWGTSNLYVADHTHSFFTGFTAFDDGVFQATGVALDFKEDIYATAAGTTISVGVPTGTFSRAGHTHSQYSTGSTVSAGGASDLLIYEDSVFKVTGTAINFTDNINVVVSGSVAHVSAVDTVGGGGGGADLLIFDNSVFKVTGTAIDFGDNLDVAITGTYVYVTAVGVTGSVGPAGPQGPEGATGSVGPQGIQGIQGPPGDNTLLIYDDNVFKVTGTALAFGDNINVVVTGSTAFISSVDTVGGGGGGGDIIIYDDATFKVTGTAIVFGTNLDVAVTGSVAFVSSSASSLWPTISPPSLSDFSWINQGSGTASEFSVGICMDVTPVAGNNARCLVKTAPSTPYTIVMGFIPNSLGADYHNCGFVWRQSSDGKLISVGITHVTDRFWSSDKFTNPTTYNANYYRYAPWSVGSVHWIKAIDNGVNRVVYVSTNGYNWTLLHSVERTDFLTADQVGFYVESANVTWNNGMLITYWSES